MDIHRRQYVITYNITKRDTMFEMTINYNQ